MSAAEYDVVIVGARCAGASLATLLSRAGTSVLLLDKDLLPSDQVLSTHTIHPPGIDVLDELGVGTAVREESPANHVVRLRKNNAFVDMQFAEGRAEYCPRRYRLDGFLQDAAVAAGAKLRDRTRATALLEEDGRVVGLRAETNEQQYTVRARLVVGANGRHSTIASLVGADEYLAWDAPRAAYWGYWEAPAFWRTDSAYPFDMYVANTDGDCRLIFPTDKDQLLISSAPPLDRIASWREDPEAALRADLESDPVIGPLIDGTHLDGRVRGTISERHFFRTATGPGWVLVGDAGHHKDWLIGDGITEALLQARSLAVAITVGTDQALVQWWRARDVAGIPYHFFGRDEGAAAPPTELQCLVFSRVNEIPEYKSRMAATFEHRLSPYDAFPVSKLLTWTLGGALRGRPGLVGQFMAMGRHVSVITKELNGRKRLLEQAVEPGIDVALATVIDDLVSGF